jgi:quercetin dioxygenase-like cupin family protein
MTNRRWTIAASLVVGLLVGISGMSSSLAQVPGFKRVELQKQDLGTPGREAVLARGEFEAGAAVPKHTHPGEEIGFVLEGELTLEIDGQPAKKLKAGDSFFVPASQVHAGKNTAKGKTVVVSTYIIEKGKPLASMVGAAPAKK